MLVQGDSSTSVVALGTIGSRAPASIRSLSRARAASGVNTGGSSGTITSIGLRFVIGPPRGACVSTSKAYTTRPYRIEFPDSPERARSSRTLEDALREARWILYSGWRQRSEHGSETVYEHDADRAVITHRETGYRWILRRSESRVEVQTPEMFDAAVRAEHIHLVWTIEEAEAVATAACSAPISDRRKKAIVEQALDQLSLLCGDIRETVRGGDLFYEWRRGIPRRPPDDPSRRPNKRKIRSTTLKKPSRRTGVGTALVTPKLEECDRQHLGAYLETQKGDQRPVLRALRVPRDRRDRPAERRPPPLAHVARPPLMPTSAFVYVG